MSDVRIAPVAALLVGARRFESMSFRARSLLEGFIVQGLEVHGSGSDAHVVLFVRMVVNAASAGLLEILDACAAVPAARVTRPGCDASYAAVLEKCILDLDAHGVLKLDLDHDNPHVRALARCIRGKNPVLSHSD